MPTVLSDSETGEAYSAAAVAKKRGKSYKKTYPLKLTAVKVSKIFIEVNNLL